VFARPSYFRATPIHPGEILLEEFLEPMGISQYRLAKDINVPPRRINEIVLGKRAIHPILPCDYLCILDFPNGSGSTCKHAMILKWKRISYKTASSAKCMCMLLRDSLQIVSPGLVSFG
jgi:hypothetical protein